MIKLLPPYGPDIQFMYVWIVVVKLGLDIKLKRLESQINLKVDKKINSDEEAIEYFKSLRHCDILTSVFKTNREKVNIQDAFDETFLFYTSILNDEMSKTTF